MFAVPQDLGTSAVVEPFHEQGRCHKTVEQLDGIILGMDVRGRQVLCMIEGARDYNRPSLLRWMFRRGDDRIVCQVDAARSVTVSLTSHGDPVRTLNEKFDDMLQAFERHAQLARQLREYGWTVASYGR